MDSLYIIERLLYISTFLNNFYYPNACRIMQVPLCYPNYSLSVGNSTMLPPLINSATNTGSSINRLSHTGLISRPQQQGIGTHNSFSMSQISPGSAIIGSPSRGTGMLMGGQSGHGSGPGMIGMGMGLPVNKPNMRLGGVGISHPGNFPGGKECL